MEHVEPAGIHSGDSNAVLPPYSLGDFVFDGESYLRRKSVMLKISINLENTDYEIIPTYMK